jgi:hypothetical protein
VQVIAYGYSMSIRNVTVVALIVIASNVVYYNRVLAIFTMFVFLTTRSRTEQALLVAYRIDRINRASGLTIRLINSMAGSGKSAIL